MIFFAALWDDVRKGNPMDVNAVKEKIELAIEHLKGMKVKPFYERG